MPKNTENSQLGSLFREEDVGHFLELSVDPPSSSMESASSYEDHTDGQTYRYEDEAPICSDLTIAPKDIKKGVKLPDVTVFRIRTGLYDPGQAVKQKLLPQYFPWDFMSDGEIRPDRQPIGKGVVINVGGMGFYPIFRDYIALCGEQAGRYTNKVGPKKGARNAPYNGFRVGPLLTMPDDFHGNSAIFNLSLFSQKTSGQAVEFFYQPGDRVGLFDNGRLILAPLSTFSGFTPYINPGHRLMFTNEQDTGLTMDEWNSLPDNGHDAEPKPSTLNPRQSHLSSASELFKLFRQHYSGTGERSSTHAMEEEYDPDSPEEDSSIYENSDEDSWSSTAGSTRGPLTRSTKARRTASSSLRVTYFNSSTRTETPNISSARPTARRVRGERHATDTPSSPLIEPTDRRENEKKHAVSMEWEDGSAATNVRDMIHEFSDFLGEACFIFSYLWCIIGWLI